MEHAPRSSPDALAAAIPRTPRRKSLWPWIVPLPPRGGGGPVYFVRWMAGRILLLYLIVCLMLSIVQRSLIYHPARAERLAAHETGLRGDVLFDLVTEGPGGEMHGWHLLPSGATAATPEEADRLLSEASLVVLYFPGNAGNRADRLVDLELFSELGAHAILFDYRGYAENPGSPSESALHEDALAVWTHLVEARGARPDRIVLYGESLGGGVAVPLAALLCRTGTPPAGVALRATFSSLPDAASCHFPWLPVRWLVRDAFRSDRAIADVTCPILHIHGSRDRVVPIELGRRLFAAAPELSAAGIPKRFVELPRADHNDLLYVAYPEFREAIREFFATLTL